MMSAVAIVEDVLRPSIWEQLEPIDESLSPTERTPGAVPYHKQAAWAELDSIPTLPGYELLEKIGRGGMARVYKARALRTQRIVAIKVSYPHLAGENDIIARFHQEQTLTVRLRHPNLVAAFDAGQIGGVPYLVLEFVEGHDLAWFVHRHGSLPMAEACEVVRQAALGLMHLHKHHLVHRDVKPANLMLSPSGQVRLLDLGVARHLRVSDLVGQITSHGQCLGTPDYMAPEQCLDCHAIDGRADIYALGCTLYELLVGQPPFSGPGCESVFLKMKGHIDSAVPPIADRRPEVPERLIAVIGRMLAKERTNRFATAACVAAAMQPFAVGAELASLSGALPVSTVGAA